MSKPREFWIQEYESENPDTDEYGVMLNAVTMNKDGFIHVIEKQAAEKLAKRIQMMIDEIEYFRKVHPNVSPTPSTVFAEQALKEYRGEK